MKIFHTVLSVKSSQKSRTFYENVFNLTFRTAGERPNLGVTFMMLQDKDGTTIELVDYN